MLLNWTTKMTHGLAMALILLSQGLHARPSPDQTSISQFSASNPQTTITKKSSPPAQNYNGTRLPQNDSDETPELAYKVESPPVSLDPNHAYSSTPSPDEGASAQKDYNSGSPPPAAVQVQETLKYQNAEPPANEPDYANQLPPPTATKSNNYSGNEPHSTARKCRPRPKK